MPIKIVLLLAFIHFVADFLCQSDWMAINKSKNWYALLAHTYTYSFVFMLSIFKFKLGLNEHTWLLFLVVTFVAHTATDAVTSRITSYLWAKQKTRLFFNVIGLDQLLHTVQLVLTYKWLVK